MPTITCHNCQFTGKAPDQFIGKKVKCRQCGSFIVVSNAPPSPPASKEEEFKECPFCSEQILASARKCKHCGELLDASLREQAETSRQSQQVVVTSAGKPVPGMAAVLEVIPGLFQVFGIGFMYAGNIAAGLTTMFAYWVLLAVNIALIFFCGIGVITLPACWFLIMILSPILAFNEAKKAA